MSRPHIQGPRTDEALGDRHPCQSSRRTPKQQSFSSAITRPHLGAVRAFGYALTLGTESGWHTFCSILQARLSIEDRAALAFTVLCSLDDDTALMTSQMALGTWEAC